MYFFFFVIEEHGSFVVGLLVCVFDDGGGSFFGFSQDGFLHLFDSFLDTSRNHLDIITILFWLIDLILKLKLNLQVKLNIN